MIYNRVSPSTINRKTHPHLKHVSRIWETDEYSILFDIVGGWRHLRIRRHDGVSISNFDDLQKIKNDLWGAEVEALQVFPKSSNLVEGSNTLHLWRCRGIALPNLKELYTYRDPDV